MSLVREIEDKKNELLEIYKRFTLLPFLPPRLVDLMDIMEVVGGTIDEVDRAAILEAITS